MRNWKMVWLGVALIALLAAVTEQAAAQQNDSARVLTLPEAIELALDQNLELRVARLEYEKAVEQADEAWGRTMPSLDASASYTHNFSVTPVFLPGAIVGQPDEELVPVRFGAENAWQFSLDASQPLFDPAVIVGVGAASRFEAYQEEVVRGTAQRIVTRARIAYYDALLAEEAARLNRQSRDRVQETLVETRAMRAAGLTSEYEVLRLEVELSNVESELRRAEDAVRASRRALAIELGLDADDAVRTAGSLSSLELEASANEEAGNRLLFQTAGIAEPEDRSVEELVAAAQRGRSEIQQLSLLEELRSAELRLERWSYLPQVSLFGTYSIAAQQNEFAFFGGEGPRGYGRLAGVRVTVPVFAGFQRPARIAQREAEVESVRVQRDRAFEQIEAEIRTLHEQVSEAHRRAEAQRRAVEQAERGFRIASAEYREGLGSRLNVTDAEVALRRAEFNYAQAVYDYLALRARLDEATGAVADFD